MEFDSFEWDDGNRTKCQKHDVSIDEIESLFFGAPLVGPDPKHSVKEQRFYGIGIIAKKRHLFVVFTLRRKKGELFIRPISARYMHKREVHAYEKESS